MEKVKINILKPFEIWLKDESRIKISHGGRGGGKSECIAKMLIAKSFMVTGKILCAREVQYTVIDSTYSLLVSIITAYNLLNYFKIYRTYIVNTVTNTSFIFRGIRDMSAENVKSIHDIKICFIEEGQSISEKSWYTLEPSVRASGSEIWIAFNPRFSTDIIYTFTQNRSYEDKQYLYKNETYYYREHKSKDLLITQINFDGNCYFKDTTLEKSRLFTLENMPSMYGHIWLGELRSYGGRIFQGNKLNTYVFQDMEDILDKMPLRCCIDLAYGEKSCFNSVILYKVFQGNIYLLDSGLLRADINRSSEEVVIDFLLKHDVSQILCEANFGQAQFVKKLKRQFKNVIGFLSKNNKLLRILDNSITIKDKVYFPYEWFTPPKDIPISRYTETKLGRGYIAIQQLLNFSDIEKENNIKNDDTSYIDFVDNLSNLVMFDKNTNEIKNSSTNKRYDVDDFDWKRIL